jgi:hypothetical protein
VNVVPDDLWTGSPDALPCSGALATQLPHILSGRLQDAYVRVLNEDIPEEWARCLERLNAQPQPIAGKSVQV